MMTIALDRHAALTRRRRSLFALFSAPGFGIASWVTRTPDIRDGLSASTAQMGLILLGLSVGSLVGIAASGRLIAAQGTRFVIIVGTTLLTIGTAVIGAGAHVGSAELVTLGLSMFGMGMGGGQVALSVNGAEVETITQRSLMPLLHGFFSFGTVIGALVGVGLMAVECPASLHMGFATVVIASLLVAAAGGLPADGSSNERLQSELAPAGRAPWRDPVLLCISFVILALTVAEGSANDWLPLLMIDGHGLDPTAGSAIYIIFAISMTVGRFAGNRLVDRFGRAAILGASAVSAAVGIALVIFADNQSVVAAAVVLWGLGASLGFPVALSAAAASGTNSSARVSIASAAGYSAFLVGPPVLGLLGEHVGLRHAMLVVLVLVMLATTLSPAAKER